MNLLLAQAVPGTLIYYVLAIIVIAGVVAVLYVVLQQMGIAIPPFIVKIFWILVAVVIGILAIKFIASLF